MPRKSLVSKARSVNSLTAVAEDRYVLAVVLVRSLSTETIWARESLGLWIIEADGVSRRLPSDGEDERIFRILVENGINIHAEVIPAQRFKKMVEGMSRTAFSCSFFAHRQIVYSKDPSIESWFKKGERGRDQGPGTRASCVLHMDDPRAPSRAKRLDIKRDLELAAQEMMSAAHSVAHTEIIRRGQMCEQDVIYRAIEGTRTSFRRSTSTCWPSARIGACCPQRSMRSTDISRSITRLT